MKRHAALFLLLAFLLAACSHSGTESQVDSGASNPNQSTESQTDGTASFVTQPSETQQTEPQESDSTEQTLSFRRLDPSYTFATLPPEGIKKSAEVPEDYSVSAFFVHVDGSASDVYCYDLSAAEETPGAREADACVIVPLISDTRKTRSFAGRTITQAADNAYCMKYLTEAAYRPLSADERENMDAYPAGAAFFFSYEDGQTDCFILSSDYRILHASLAEYPVPRREDAEAPLLNDPNTHSESLWLPELQDCDAVTLYPLEEVAWLHLYVLAAAYIESTVLTDSLPIYLPGDPLHPDFELQYRCGSESGILQGEARTELISLLTENGDLSFASLWEGEWDPQYPEGTLELRFLSGGNGTPLYICPDGTLYVRPVRASFEVFGTMDGLRVENAVQLRAVRKYPYEALRQILVSAALASPAAEEP